MTKLLSELNNLRSHIALVEAFLIKRPDVLPEEVYSFTMWGGEKPRLYLSVGGGYSTETNRQRALAAIGDGFGRDGWIKTPDNSTRSYDYSKTVDGVELFVADAEPMPTEVAQPVPPNAFPLMLEEPAAATPRNNDILF